MDDLLLRWLDLAAARVAAAREELTALDAAIGDGDHGVNLERGFRALARAIDAGELSGEAPAAVLQAAGRILMGTVGGASGALYGRGLQRAGAALAGLSDQTDVPAARGRKAAVALEAAIDAIAALGRSTPGEKTMLDALVPARDAYRAALDEGASMTRALTAAASAAEAGAERTIPLLATKGRASYLGERSIGHLDPGAVSSALLLRALADAAARG